MPNFRLLLAALSFIASPLLAQQGQTPGKKPSPLQTGVILPGVTATKQPGQSYALFLPSQYAPGKRWPIVYAFDPGAPFGGYKNSGIGRENGPEGIEQYTEAKSILLPFGYTPDS